MKERISQAFLLSTFLLSCCIFAGCRTEYVFQIKDSKSSAAVTKSTIMVTTLPKRYGYLDIRHYLTECGEIITAEGQTDVHGMVTLDLPSDRSIWHVSLNNEWFAEMPLSDWKQMVPKDEHEGKVAEDAPKGKQIGPLIRMQKK